MNKRGWIIVLGAVGALILIWLIAPKDHSQQSELSKTWEVDSPVPQADPTNPVTPQIKMTIHGFVDGYYSWSYQDATADAWIDRAAKWCSDRYARKLVETYGRGDSGSAWSEIQDNRQVSSAQNLEISQLSLTDDKAEFLVSFDHVTESAEGDGYRADNKLIELVNTREGWLVNSWDDFSDGPKFVDEVAPTDSPDDQYFIG